MRVSKLVRNAFEDSSADYEDLLGEMNVPLAARDDVFKHIREFRLRSDHLERMKGGSEAAHRRINISFFGAGSRGNIARIERLDGPLKDLGSVDRWQAAQELLTPIVNRMWSRMRDLLFEVSSQNEEPPSRRRRIELDHKNGAQPSSQKRKAPTLSPTLSVREPTSRYSDSTISESETYNIETVRLLDAVLGTSLLPHNKSSRVQVAKHPDRSSVTPSIQGGNDPEEQARAINPDVVTISSVTHSSTGMDHAWEVVGEMIKKRQRGDGADPSEFLLVYSRK